LVGIKNYQGTPRVVNAPLDLATKLKVLRRAMLCLLVLTVKMAHSNNVIEVIFAKEKPPIKPLANPDPTLPKQARFHVLNVHRAHLQLHMELLLAQIVVTIHTNLNPMRRNAFRSKKGTTNQVQQQKLNAQQVKPVLVVTKHAMIVKLVGIKNYQGTPRVVNAPLDLATKLKVLRRAMLCLLGRTVGTAQFMNVTKVIIAKEKPPIKPRVILDRMQPKQAQFYVLNVHRVHMLRVMHPQHAPNAMTMHTNQKHKQQVVSK
jgi:hypothetical protein